jgi:hypothetical protein
MRADWLARLDALRQRWETSRDREALLGALVFYQARLPEWLFKGLMAIFEELSRDPHATRFLAVRYAHDALGLRWMQPTIGPAKTLAILPRGVVGM